VRANQTLTAAMKEHCPTKSPRASKEKKESSQSIDSKQWKDWTKTTKWKASKISTECFKEKD
jgi:hypothetical protein